MYKTTTVSKSDLMGINGCPSKHFSSAPHYLIIDLNGTQATKSKQASSTCKNSAQ